MKHFIKVFVIAIVCFSLMLGAAVYTYVKFFNPSEDNYTEVEDPLWNEKVAEEETEKELSELEKAIEESKVINILLVGLEEKRSDTIMLVSFDRKSGDLNILSIPRDTYFYRSGYENPGDKKINAIYSSVGIKGLMKAVENIMDIPVHNYVTVDYEAVENVVDIIGGVEVDVPFHMEYEDPYDNPPLKIDIPAGTQVLDGEHALQYLRFRHNNDMTTGYKDGDIGRIKAQQEFVKSAIKKSLSFKLPVVVKETYSHIKTDLSLSDMLLLASDAVNFSTDKLETAILPGRAKIMENLSFYLHDPSQVEDYVESIYGLE
ncbi:MAG TPA: LytR family transcriptional regulator [Clostridiales bacterium]|jgi:LCP family protein required for cell wall assembly|nr:LytR family transcriptional regulator [Clostridiales bacterium]